MKKFTIYILSIVLVCSAYQKSLAQYFPYNWAKELGNNGPGVLTLNGACTTTNNHYISVGKILGTVDVDLTGNTHLIGGGISGTSTVGFFAEYDSSANLIKSYAIGGLSPRISFEAINVDANGNYIIAGTFRDSANFDINNSSSFIQATGASNLGDGFIAKYNSNMNLIWVKVIPATNVITPRKIEIDNQNNIILSGVYGNTIDIDPSNAVYNLSTYNTGNSSNDVFLAKYDGNGNFIWGKSLGSTLVDNLGGIGVDDSNNIYIGVSFAGSTAFIDSSVSFTGISTNAMCIVKFLPNGQLSYYKPITTAGSPSYVKINALKVSSLGEVYFTGVIAGNAYFQNPSIQVVAGTGSGCDFLAKLNTVGDCEWAYCAVSDVSVGYSLDMDNQSNIYLSGTFIDSKDFDYKAGTVLIYSNPSTSNNLYIASYDATGTYRWAYRIPTTGNPLIKVFDNGKVWMQGDYNSNADFDPGTGVNNLLAANATQYLTTCTSNGTYQTAAAFNKSNALTERVTAIDASISNNIIVAGTFSGTINFNNSLNDIVRTSTLDSNAYIASYSNTGTLLWVNQLKGRALIKAIKRDQAGNIYVTGYFVSATYFDENTPTFYISTTTSDIFIGKYDPNGVMLWIHRIGGAYIDEGHDLSIDANGNVVVTGTFADAIDFDPSAASFQLTTPQLTTNGFIAKYTGNGNFIHALKLVVRNATSVCTDNNNNIFVTGNMVSFGNFNAAGGGGVVYCTGGSNDYDYYLAKYDSAGNYLWAFKIGGYNSNNQKTQIALDNAGNIYFEGFFVGSLDSVDIDPSANENYLNSGKGILIKYSNNGNLLWGINSGFYIEGQINVDANGNPTLVAQYLNNGDLDPTNANASWTTTTSSIVAARYSTVGQYLGAQVYSLISSNAIISPTCISINDSNSVYIGGYFSGSIDFDVNPGYQNVFFNSNTNSSGFLIALSQPNYLAQIPPSAAFSSSSSNFCAGLCISFQDNSLYSPNNWNWSFPGANPSSSTSQNPTNICYPNAGTYNVQLIVSNPLGTDTLLMNNFIVVDAIPQTNAGNDISVCEGSSLQLNGSGATNYSWSPSATLVNPNSSNPIASPLITTTYTLTGTNGSCSTSDDITITVNQNPTTPQISPVLGELQSTPAYAYQWYYNGVAITGATLQTLFPTQIGNYTVTVFDSLGCFASSNSYLVTVVGLNIRQLETTNYTISPNPINNQINILASKNNNNVQVNLFDLQGKLILTQVVNFVKGTNMLDFNASSLNSGMYRLELKNSSELHSLKILKVN